MGSTNTLNDSPFAYCYRRTEPQLLQLVNNLGKLFNDQSLFDCSIICEGNQVIRGHKLMLSASSDYFKTAFTSFGGGNDHNGHSVSHSCSNTAIIIKEIPYHDLKLIIDYIYSGEMVIPAGQLSSIRRSCQWLKVNCLPLTVTSPGLIPIKSVSAKVNSNANCATSNRIKIKSDATATIKVNNGRLSINENTLPDGHHQNNVTNSLNRIPSLLYPFRSTNQLIKIVDASQSIECGDGSKGVKNSSSSSLSLKIISSPNEVRKVHSTSTASGESFVQLRELLRRDPAHPDSGNEGNGNRNDETTSNQEEGGVEEQFDQNRVDRMKHEDCNGDDGNIMDDDHGEGVREEEEREKMDNDDGKQEELIVEEDAEGEVGTVIEEDSGGEEDEKGEDDKYNECNDGQGQGVDSACYLSSEEFEIDIPRSNDLHQSDSTYHQKSDILRGVVDEFEDENEEEEGGGLGSKMQSERNGDELDCGGEDEGEEDEDDEEDEVIDMRVNSGRRFDSHSLGHYASHHSYAAFQGQNFEAAAAAVAAVAAAAASTTGSTSAASNLLDECPSSDSLDLDCGDKLRATNYSMIPFTASIASSFNSATARAIAASTTLAVASGLLSKSQQLQNHSSSSSSSSSTTTTTTTTPGIDGLHLKSLTNSSSSHQLHSHHQSSSHPLQHHPHEMIFKTTSSNSDSHSDVSTVPLKRGRGRPPRHLRETPLNGSSSHNTNSSPLEPFRTYKVRNILPSATTSDLILQSTNTSNTKGNQLNGDTNNHHHLILSTSSALGLTLKRKRLNNNNGHLIGLVSGSSTKGRKPKLSTQSADCQGNNGKNVCPFCPQVYYSNQAMSDHINNVHTRNSCKYTCDLCSKEFSWKISLTKHLRNSHKSPDKVSEQLTTNNLIDSRQQLTLTNM